MAKQENNRTRITIPIQGIDTSTPDLTAPDGKCEELHNLRWAAGSWHDVPPLAIKKRLYPAPGREEWFSKVKFVYHHPAADNNTYITSIPNDDGTINLFQVTVDGEFLKIIPEVCPLYVYKRLQIIDVEHTRTLVSIVSLKPVASNISVIVKYKTSLDNTCQSLAFILAKGETESKIEFPKGFNLISTHLDQADDTSYHYVVFPNEAEATKNGEAFAANLPADTSISHFGNTLILIRPDTTPLYYFLDNNRYVPFDTSELSVDISINTSKRVIQPNTTSRSETINTVQHTHQYTKLCDITGTTLYYMQGNGDYWSGEICLFVALRMEDGTVVAQTTPAIIASELEHQFPANQTIVDRYSRTYYPNYYVVKNFDGEPFICLKSVFAYQENLQFTTNNFLFLPEILIKTGDIKSDKYKYIKDIAIYSTRINPTFDYGKIVEKYQNWIVSGRRYGDVIDPERFSGSTDLSDLFADNKLLEQSFYLIKTISKDELVDDNISLSLKFDLLHDVETGIAYEPNQYAHILSFAGIKEYNSRTHFFNMSTYYSQGNSARLPYEYSAKTSEVNALVTDIKKDNQNLSVVRYESTPYSEYLNPIITYPDANAVTIRIVRKSDNNMFDVYRILALSASKALNIAYYISPPEILKYGQIGSETGGTTTVGAKTCYVKYPFIVIPVEPSSSNVPIPIVATCKQPNRIQVSGTGNPFNLPYANSYAIGTNNNRILAINSAAIEMSDAKFGEFPLYVFTEEGIFTLQSGSGEVLYSSVVPLNYDRIINADTLAVNHNILYMTARGIQAMFSNDSKLISGPINDRHDLPPLEYLRGALMCYQHPTNEVIVWNQTTADSRAYVFSLDNGCWSTRDFEGGKLNIDELVVRRAADTVDLLELNSETRRAGVPIPVRLVSRPVKFGSAEFKRLETFIPRFRSATPQSVRLLFEGSADLVDWFTMRDTDVFSAIGYVTVRRFPHSVRYLRVTLEADTDTGIELTQFDAEYYLRFVHRLR